MTEMQQDRIALDRGSVRTIDQDGHLHISLNPISKSNICGYAGSEVPDAEALGLRPDQIYQLYRDPEELRKSVRSWDGKPLLIVHKPQSADEHSRNLTVGSVKNPKWDSPYLKAELDIWDGEAIAGIQDGDRREISCGYRYRADMTPGEINGIKYDGVMRDIVANHVALVTTGRAGSDVVVGDSAIQPQPTEIEPMTATTLPRSVQVAAIALDTYLRPKLVKDVKIDLSKLLIGKTGKSWATSKPQIKLGLDAAVKDKLAKDADISDVIEMLDRLDDVVDEEEEPTPRGSDATGELSEDEEAQYQALAKRRPSGAANAEAEDEEDDEEKKKKEAEDAEEDDEDEEKKKKAEWVKDKAAKDKAAKDKAAKDKAAKDKQAKDGAMITKAAMDAALAEQATKTEAATIARLAAIRVAEDEVRPWVGPIAIPQKSVEDVYRLALDTLNVDVKGLHPDALRPILMAQRKPGDEEPRRPAPARVAMDSAANDEFSKMFPNALKILSR